MNQSQCAISLCAGDAADDPINHPGRPEESTHLCDRHREFVGELDIDGPQRGLALDE